jgi:hypothetical protein
VAVSSVKRLPRNNFSEIADNKTFFESKSKARANPTIASYNASALKTYNTTSSLLRFDKTFLFCFKKTFYPNTTLAL